MTKRWCVIPDSDFTATAFQKSGVENVHNCIFSC